MRGHPFRRLGIAGAVALGVVTVFLNGLTLRHATRLNHDARALVVARLVTVGASLRRHAEGRHVPSPVEGERPDAPPDPALIREWLESDEATDIVALRLLGRPGQRLFEWERDPGRVPFAEDDWPDPGHRRRPFLEPSELRSRDGVRVFRGWMPFGPPDRPGRFPPVPEREPRGRIAIDLVPTAVLDLLAEGRLLVLGGAGATAALWAALGLLVVSDRRRRRLQDELEKRERLAEVGRMAAVLAHQIRNPLAAIKGHAQLALERTEEDAIRRGLDHVVTESARLEDLASRLLHYTRPLEPQRKDCALEGLFDEVRRARPDAARVETAVDATSIPADRQLLREALAALLDNALRAAGETGRVRLSAVNAGDDVVVAVDDAGPGIPEVRRAEVTRPFGTTRPDGAGLGLPLAARIAEAHGGRLHVEQSTLGGARVALILPRGRGDER
jgi:two-component system sensor histidine kinase HydH